MPIGYMNIQGVRLDVLNATSSQKRASRGRRRRSHRGQVRDNRRGIRRSWDCSVKFADWEEATAIQHMLLGDGHVAHHLLGRTGSTGLTPSYTKHLDGRLLPDVEIRLGRGSGGYFFVDADGTLLTYEPQLVDGWTVVWEESDGIPSTSIVARRDDGVAFLDGVQDDDAGAEFSASTGVNVVVREGNLFLESITGAEMIVGDVAILPWRASKAQMEFWTSPGAPRFGPQPVLWATGDFLSNGEAFVQCELRGSPFLGKAPGDPVSAIDEWRNSAKTVLVTVHEIDDQFVRELMERDAVLPGTPLYDYDAANTDALGNASLGVFGATRTAWTNGLGNQVGADTLAPVTGSPTLRRLDLANGFRHRSMDFAAGGALQVGGLAAPASPSNFALLVGRADVSNGYFCDGDPAGTGRLVFRYVFGAGLQMYQGTSFITGADPGLGNWFWAVAEFEGSGSRLRVNGVKETEVTGNPGTADGYLGLTIGGRFNNTTLLDGAVSKLTVWGANGFDDVEGDPLDAIDEYARRRYPELVG